MYRNKIITSSGATIDILSRFFDLVSTFESDAKLAIQNDISFGETELSKIKSSGIKLIGVPRFNKIEQSKILERYNINHPKSFYDYKSFTAINDIGLLNSYVDLDEFVVKPILGARGLGVKKITRVEYIKCLYGNDKSIDEVFSKEKEYIKNNCDYNDITCDYINSNFHSMLIQESIDVDREFRVIIFNGSDSITYERVKSNNQFCGNLSFGSKPKKVSKKTFSKYLTPIIESFKDIMSEFSYPWLSIDVYVDKDGNIGVFEFQMEFAYDGFNHILVRDAMKKTIESYI